MANLSSSEDLIRVKGSDRIQIINILAAVSITILSVLLGLSGQTFSNWMVVQLAASTPLLITASLAYAKTCYRPGREFRLWDRLGWVTLSLGYGLILNMLALLLFTGGYPLATGAFMATVMILFVVYSALDVAARGARLEEKLWKLIFYLVLLGAGSLLPIAAGWV